MQSIDPSMTSEATMTGQRWSVRFLSVLYYFTVGPLLFDLFTQGARGRSAYLFPFILLSVTGLQASFKENDRWVRLWYWTNLPLLILVTLLAFFSEPFRQTVSLYTWEKWIHFAFLLCAILFAPLHYILPRKPMVPIGSEADELERDLPLARPTSEARSISSNEIERPVTLAPPIAPNPPASNLPPAPLEKGPSLPAPPAQPQG